MKQQSPTPFEQFVQKIAAVPKEAVEEAEAHRGKRVRRPRFKLKAKK